jgi:hypothetical protein
VIGHLGTEIGAADADVDDVADAPAGVAGPAAEADPLGERCHPVEDLMDLRHHVLAVHLDARAARGAQGDVQNGALFGDIDPFATEHRVTAGRHVACLGEREEQTQRLLGDAVLRVVKEDSGRLRRKALRPGGIACEQLAQMHVLDLRVVRGERLPR